MSGMETEGCVFFEEKLEKKKDTRYIKKTQAWREKGKKRHKVGVRVVPLVDKKGPSKSLELEKRTK